MNSVLVTSCSGSLVRPKVVRSVHYCPATKKTMERKYTDMTSLDAFPSNAIYPTKVGFSFFSPPIISFISVFPLMTSVFFNGSSSYINVFYTNKLLSLPKQNYI